MNDDDSSRCQRSGPREPARGLWLGVAICGAALLPPLLVSCGSDPPPSGTTTTDTTTTTGAGGAGGDVGFDGGVVEPIVISPQDPIVKVEVPTTGQSVQFTCTDRGTGLPAQVTWELSNLEIGTIDGNGLFTPNGKRVGDVKVTCHGAESKADTHLKVIIHASDNVGGVTQAQIDLLKGPPGAADSKWQFMYPYDKTVFPRGILAPEIHLTPGQQPGTQYFVNIVAPGYSYEGFFSVGATSTQLQMSQQAWDALTNAAGGQKVNVQISKLVSNTKYGPISRTWILANGKLHGTVYYNTYDSPLAGGDGAMMRIQGSSPTPEVLVGNCTVCHSVSSDGSTAAAANHYGPGGTFDLSSGQVNPPLVWQDPEKAAFAGLYPDGSVLVVNGAPGQSYPPNTPGTSGVYFSELRTKNGTIIPNSGIEGYYAQTPVFSHDGNRLAFYDRVGGDPFGDPPGVLATMSYDPIAQKFSGYQVLATPPVGRHCSWPAFTPDNEFVVYQDGVGADLATWSSNTGRLFAVNVQTRQVTYLSKLNGDGYMPAGSRDENKNYEPTIAPVASGGYFWIMFTSRRTYGNKLTGGESETKRLWVAAFDPNAPDGVDPTHPAFYIAGQELTSGNSRGFWALDPCKEDGATCESGDECCNGYCNPTGNPPQYLCGPPDGECSGEFEPCETTADCCDDVELECIGGICTQLPPG